MTVLTDKEVKEIITQEINQILEGSRVEARKLNRVRELLRASMAKLDGIEQTINPATNTSGTFPAVAFYIDDLLDALERVDSSYS